MSDISLTFPDGSVREYDVGAHVIGRVHFHSGDQDRDGASAAGSPREGQRFDLTLTSNTSSRGNASSLRQIAQPTPG